MIYSFFLLLFFVFPLLFIRSHSLTRFLLLLLMVDSQSYIKNMEKIIDIYIFICLYLPGL